ncbi:sensor domain-containing diguanylate cyclase [Oxalobacteraceae bacterium OM1]|nr:sensor domain-containing diguanylate cyclase [Oxalobacteraceae bacterium OM1]
MSHELAAENLRLRKQLEQLLETAEENQRILERYHAFDLQFIGAGSFRELIDALFLSFPEAARLDVVTLALLDPDYDIRRMLAELQINLAELPHLLFLEEATELGELLASLSRPVLGTYAQHLHGPMFPEPIPAPASVSIVPLRRQDRLIGCLAIGSHDATRFAAGMATDFIEHMAAIVAVCFENVINHERLKHLGLTDPLTGVNNRRYVERRLLEEAGRCRRQGYALSCMYIDIDHFKRINDRCGHQAGDEVLRGVAGRIKAELRLSDALGRFGGEEFVVLLIDAELPDAIGVAERIRQSVGELPMLLSNGESLDVTVSVGVTTLQPAASTESVDELVRRFLQRADQALYQAKEAGRNRVVGWTEGRAPRQAAVSVQAGKA